MNAVGFHTRAGHPVAGALGLFMTATAAAGESPRPEPASPPILKAEDLPSRGFKKERGPQYLVPLYK